MDDDPIHRQVSARPMPTIGARQNGDPAIWANYHTTGVAVWRLSAQTFQNWYFMTIVTTVACLMAMCNRALPCLPSPQPHRFHLLLPVERQTPKRSWAISQRGHGAMVLAGPPLCGGRVSPGGWCWFFHELNEPFSKTEAVLPTTWSQSQPLPKGAEKKNDHIESSHLVPNSWEPASATSVWSAHPFHIQLQASQTQYGPSSSCRSGQTRWRLLSSIILGSGGWAKLWYMLDLLWQFPSWNSWRFISQSNSVSCGNLGDLWGDLWVCAEECWQLNKAHQFVAANKGLRTMTTKLLEIASSAEEWLAWTAKVSMHLCCVSVWSIL